jgi:hypothetical protein
MASFSSPVAITLLPPITSTTSVSFPPITTSSPPLTGASSPPTSSAENGQSHSRSSTPSAKQLTLARPRSSPQPRDPPPHRPPRRALSSSFTPGPGSYTGLFSFTSIMNRAELYFLIPSSHQPTSTRFRPPAHGSCATSRPLQYLLGKLPRVLLLARVRSRAVYATH